MTDDEFLQAVSQGTLTAFHHRDHVRLAWILARRSDPETAVVLVSTAIRAFATSRGHGAKFHHTITEFWVQAVAKAASRHADVATADELMSAEPRLFDQRLPWLHWSNELLMSEMARQNWVEPDLLPLSDIPLG